MKMNPSISSLKKQIRFVLLFFMVALALSGVTAIPVETELTTLLNYFSSDGVAYKLFAKVLDGIQHTNEKYPFLLYGYDWLAFAHFVIAVVFLGPCKDPVKNIWVIEFGLIACAMVIPFALVMGGIRGLPLWWRLGDCSFGVIGAIPLWFCRNKILQLEKLMQQEKLNLIF